MGVTGVAYKGVARPSTNVMSATATGSAAANTWYQLIAATTSSILITGITTRSSATDTVATVDIGTGAAGSETVVYSTLHFEGALGYTTIQYTLAVPLRIPAGTRIATRNTLSGITVAILYVVESQVA